MRILTVIASIATLVIAASHCVIGQTVGDDSKRLTGGATRDWVLKALDTYMAGNSCKAGEIWRFSVDHRATILKCVSGKIRAHTVRWSLQRVSDLDTTLTIGAKAYDIVFENDNGKPQLVLSVGITGRKPDPIKELIFSASQD